MSVRTEIRGAVVRVSMDRPSHHNALDESLIAGLASAIRSVDADSQVRAVVLAGTSRSFCAGADLGLVNRLLQAPPAGPSPFAPAFDAITESSTPIVAAVRGAALGGGTELVLACHTVIAGRGAKFGLPEVTLGLIPGAGGTQRLRHAVGTVRARHLLLTGELVDAEWALRSGLVAEVVEDESVLDRAHHVAATIAANSADAVRAAQAAFTAGLNSALAAGLAAETAAFNQALTGSDAKEGVTAFTERRPARFGDR